jgi:HD-GYP domain-containing protein (c-di-GMP phosphodiesterase class II)
MMETAGNIHDLGKLSVPKSILEKPGKLTGAEFNVMRGHTYHGYRAFETLPELNVISEWAFLHHERLDGSGYPFHYKKDELSLGARIMCIADVFAALTEDRPYRDGMPPEKAFGILKKMADEGKQDADILSIMEPELEMINTKRAEAQEEARESYTYMNGKR